MAKNEIVVRKKKFVPTAKQRANLVYDKGFKQNPQNINRKGRPRSLKKKLRKLQATRLRLPIDMFIFSDDPNAEWVEIKHDKEYQEELEVLNIKKFALSEIAQEALYAITVKEQLIANRNKQFSKKQVLSIIEDFEAEVKAYIHWLYEALAEHDIDTAKVFSELVQSKPINLRASLIENT